MNITGIDSKSLKQGDPEPPPLAAHHYRLYAMRFCPYCERVLIAASAKGTKLEVVNINMSKKPEWFVNTTNPRGAVPLLKHDREEVQDSRAIIEYLDKHFPETSILPKEQQLLEKQQLHLDHLGPLCDTIMDMVHSPTLTTADPKKLEAQLVDAEALLQSDYYAGKKFGLADIMLFPFIERLEIMRQFNNAPFLQNDSFSTRFPKLVKWFARMQTNPAVAAAQQPRQLLTAFMISLANHKADFDIGLPWSKTPTDLKLLATQA